MSLNVNPDINMLPRKVLLNSLSFCVSGNKMGKHAFQPLCKLAYKSRHCIHDRHQSCNKGFKFSNKASRPFPKGY